MTAQDDLAEDTAWMVGRYEPRVNVAGVTVRTDDAKMRRVVVDVDINEDCMNDLSKRTRRDL